MTFVAPTGTRLVRSVGAGATFEVALVERAGVVVIAKRVRASALESPIAHAALAREASALALLSRDLVPALVAEGTDAAGAYVLEEHLTGPSLRDVREALTQRPLGELAAAAARLVERTHAAADAGGPIGYVHGDLAPDHFVFDAHASLRLIDHGASQTRAHPSASGGRGTLPFVAPELCRGETPPTPATDRYALAVVLASLLTGQRLVRTAEHGAMLLEIGDRGHDLASLERLAPELGTLLARHLDPDPRRRPSGLDALADPRSYDALDAAIRS